MSEYRGCSNPLGWRVSRAQPPRKSRESPRKTFIYIYILCCTPGYVGRRYGCRNRCSARWDSISLTDVECSVVIHSANKHVCIRPWPGTPRKLLRACKSGSLLLVLCCPLRKGQRKKDSNIKVSLFHENVYTYSLQDTSYKARVLALPYFYFCRFTMDAARPAYLSPHTKATPARIIFSPTYHGDIMSCLEQYRLSNVHRNELNIPLGDLPLLRGNVGYYPIYYLSSIKLLTGS